MIQDRTQWFKIMINYIWVTRELEHVMPFQFCPQGSPPDAVHWDSCPGEFKELNKLFNAAAAHIVNQKTLSKLSKPLFFLSVLWSRSNVRHHWGFITNRKVLSFEFNIKPRITDQTYTNKGLKTWKDRDFWGRNRGGRE